MSRAAALGDGAVPVRMVPAATRNALPGRRPRRCASLAHVLRPSWPGLPHALLEMAIRHVNR